MARLMNHRWRWMLCTAVLGLPCLAHSQAACEEAAPAQTGSAGRPRSEEHTSELQSPCNLVCRLLLEKKKKLLLTTVDRRIDITQSLLSADGRSGDWIYCRVFRAASALRSRQARSSCIV